MKPAGTRPGQRSRAMSDRARLFIVPLVVLSVVLAALLVAIIVVLVVRDRGPGIDQCVVGTWRVTAHREEVSTARLGKVTFTGTDTPATVRLSGDGTGVTDYGTGTRFDGVASGHAVRLEVTGKVTYRYSAADGRLSFRDPGSGATGTLFVDDVEAAALPFTTGTAPADYECSADRLTFRTGRYETTLSRAGR